MGEAFTYALAAIGALTGVLALVVNRFNARDSSKLGTSTLAHDELVDLVNAQVALVQQYRQQVDDTRQQLAAQERQMVELRQEHQQCQTALVKFESQLRIAEARITELGG